VLLYIGCWSGSIDGSVEKKKVLSLKERFCGIGEGRRRRKEEEKEKVSEGGLSCGDGCGLTMYIQYYTFCDI